MDACGRQPLLSIIVATRNAGRTLERCLASVASQTFKDWELILIDGASNDNTLEIIGAHAEMISYWQSRPDQGIYDAWNQALDHARGEYVTFLGADDRWYDDDTLARLFGSMGGRSFDLVSGQGRLVGVRQRRPHVFGHAWDYAKVRRRMTICHPGALHRRDLFRRFGTFDMRYRICADYDFILRLPHDVRTHYVACPIVDIDDAGISRKRHWLLLRERYRAQRDCPRVGRARAVIQFLDKLWRIPVARALGIPN